MAVRWLTSSGNWSSTSVWNDGALLGIPTTGDDVYANGFTVNMDANATVNSLNNSARARTIATPAMIANNAPSPYVAAASTIAGTGNNAWHGFDRSSSTAWVTPGGTTTGWLSMDFGSGIVIDAYTIIGSATQSVNPRNWELQGSNNNITWTPLHTVTLPSAIASSSSYSSGSIGNITSYRYYRVNITLNGTGSQLALAELELYEPGTAALAAGGSFNFNTAGVSVSCTSTSQGASNLFTITHTTGNVSLSVGNNMTAVTSQTTMTYSGNGNFSITSPNLIVNSSGGTTQLISKSGTGQITINGKCLLGTGTNSGAQNYVLNSSNGDTIINGDVNGFPGINAGGASNLQTIRQTSGNLTINGNITPVNIPISGINTIYTSVLFSGTSLTLNGNTNGGDNYAIVSAGTVNVNGNLVGGNSVYANSTITINVTGNVYAGTLAPAINCSANTASVVNLTGNMYNTNGRNAIWCPNVFISNTATTLWRMDTGGGATKTLYSADSTPNLPSISNVRNLVQFGPALSLTGTMVVPAASDTRKNVPVDNTVGTGELTSADIISGINASSDSLAVRLKNILTDKAAGNIISQYKDA